MLDNINQLLADGRPRAIIDFFDEHFLPRAPADSAMWRDRAFVLIEALIPPLVWQRDHQSRPLSLKDLNDDFRLEHIIKLSRDVSIPDKFRQRAVNYLNDLPGYQAHFFNDDGSVCAGDEKPYLTTTQQQHGYLIMQFTKSLKDAAARMQAKIERDDDIFL